MYLDYRNKQWYSPKISCMDVLDNNELGSLLIALINSFLCKVLECIKKNFIHKIITTTRTKRPSLGQSIEYLQLSCYK